MSKIWWLPRLTAAKPVAKKPVMARKSGANKKLAPRQQDNFGKSLLLSLVLHLLLLSLQFGEPGSGLPWLGMSGSARTASIPTLNAILRSQVDAVKPVAEQGKEPLISSINMRAAKPLVREPPPPRLPPEPATASVAKLVTLPQVTGEKGRVAGVAAEVPKIDAADVGTAVLSTDRDSTWHQPATKARQEEEVRSEQPAVEKTGEAPPLEQKMVEDLARIEEEKAALAAIAREKELVLERKRAEDQARIEAKKVEQASAAKAREEALAKQAEAEALARQRQAEKIVAEKAAAEKLLAEKVLAEKLAAEKAAAEKAAAEKVAAEKVAAEKVAAEKRLAAEQSRFASTASGKPEGGKEAGSGAAAERGGDLARRALDMARSGLPGLPAREPVESARARRGSILGRDPKDIQLVFYGDGWRQKVERIGSLNYPKLSRNLVYEPLVVTVSINSDGTLAGLRIDKSSGHRDLDEAVRRIVEMSAPFAAFPPDLKRSYDVVDITRTWTFLEERPRIVNQ